MRNTIQRARSGVRGAVGLIALASVAVLSGPVSVAIAGDHTPVLRSAYGASAPGAKKALKPRTHSSRLKISHNERLPQTREISIATSKSMLVELPRGLKDVLVSDPKIVDAVVQTSNRVYLIGKASGQANAFFFDEYGEQILTLEITVDADGRPLQRLLTRLIPGSNIVVEVLADTVILSGSVRNPADANMANDIAERFAVGKNFDANIANEKKVINLLKVEGEEQVMLRVHVMEVARTILSQFGVNLSARFNTGNFVTSLLTDNALPLTSAAGLGSLPTPGLVDGALSNFNTGGVSNGQEFFGNSGTSSHFRGGGQAVSKALRALERVGLVKTLAEPNLTAVSGESAKFLAGGEYPIPLVDTDGRLGVEFKEFGVALAFTPQVMSEGRISLKMDTEVSELSNEGAVTLSNISIPALRKRTATTTVELPSGGSLALAGLVSKSVRQNVDGLPGLKDLPILGTLFRSKDFIQSETELMIIVTPYVVRPTARSKLTSPGKGLHMATERKQTFLGQLNRVYGTGTPTTDGGLKGDYGFIVE